IATLELAQRAGRIIAAGPALLGVTNSGDFTTGSSVLDREVREASRRLSELPGQGLTAERLIEIRRIFRVVTANLDNVKSVVQARIAAADRKSALVRDTFDAYNQFRALWTPKFNELKGHILNLQRALNDSRSAPEQKLAAFDRLNAAISDLTPLEQVQQEAAVAFEALVRAGTAATPADLDALRAEAEAAVRRIDGGRTDTIGPEPRPDWVGCGRRAQPDQFGADRMAICRPKRGRASDQVVGWHARPRRRPARHNDPHRRQG